MTPAIKRIQDALKKHPLEGVNPLEWEVEYYKHPIGDVHTVACMKSALIKLDKERIKTLKLKHFGTSFNNLSHDCFARLTPQEIGGGVNLKRVADALEALETLPSWDEVKIIDSPAAAEHFFEVLSPIFSNFRRIGISGLHDFMAQWMHLNKGYPAEPTEILDVYLSKIKEMRKEYLPYAITEILKTQKVESNERSLEQKLKNIYPDLSISEILVKELKENTRLVGYSNCRVYQMKMFEPFSVAIINAEINALNPGDRILVGVPSLLGAAAELCLAILSAGSTKVSWVPTPEDLETVELLASEGFSLEEALLSAYKLK